MDRSLTRWSKNDDDELQLSAQESQELARAMTFRGRERLEAILASSAPAELVRAMARAEVFYTFGELEEEEEQRMLLHLASGQQIDFLLDLDLWERDEITPERALAWIERLILAGADQAVKWVMRARSEQVVTVLQQLIEVTMGPVGSQAVLAEALDDLPPFTAEGIYYIYFKHPGSERLLKTLMIQVASEDLEYYLSLLGNVLSLTRSEAEEEAREQRWNRLRDEGFLPPEEAYEIYCWPSPAELRLDAPERRELDQTAPRHATTALALAGPAGLLAAASEGLTREELIELSRSLAFTGAQILTADHLPAGDLESHRKALGKALGYVNLGLERLAEGDAERARAALKQKGPQALFRLGFAEVTALAKRAAALRRQGWLRNQIGLGLNLLGEPLGEVVKALTRPRPLYPARALDQERADRDFRNLEEVARCAELLDRGETLRRLFIDGLGLDLAPAEVFDLEGCIPPNPAELTLGLILRTAMAQLVVDGTLRFAPIDEGRLSELLQQLRAESDPELLASGLRRKIFDTLKDRLDQPRDSDLAHLAELVDRNLSELWSSLGGLDPKSAIDPRFIGAVVIRHG
jgi:hypothetical protein